MSAGRASFVIVARFVHTWTCVAVAMATPSLTRANAKWKWHDVVPSFVTFAVMRALSP